MDTLYSDMRVLCFQATHAVLTRSIFTILIVIHSETRINTWIYPNPEYYPLKALKFRISQDNNSQSYALASNGVVYALN